MAVKAVTADHELILLSRDGVIIRLAAQSMRAIQRSTQGVRLMDLRGDDYVVDVSRLAAEGLDAKNGEEEEGSESEEV